MYIVIRIEKIKKKKSILSVFTVQNQTNVIDILEKLF